MTKQVKKIILFLVLLISNQLVLAQKTKLINLPHYDKEYIHFGFSLAVNKADFVLSQKNTIHKADSILRINAIPEWGINLGIVSDIRLHDYLTIRFLPALSFQTRTVEFHIDSTNKPGNAGSYIARKQIESSLLDFPINFKIRSERVNNTSAYLLAGGKFSIDLGSQAKTKNPEILKLTSKDWSLETGFGLDFYLVYFKLSTEIKFSAGLKDRLYHENTSFSSPLDRIFTKTWLFSLNFEG